MDFVKSYFFTIATLTSCPLFSFCHHIWVGATAKQQQTHPKVMTEWKKWATGQSCIRKEITSYKIHTLEILSGNMFIFTSILLGKQNFWWAETTTVTVKHGIRWWTSSSDIFIFLEIFLAIPTCQSRKLLIDLSCDHSDILNS